MFKHCPIYSLKSKKQLKEKFNIHDNKYLHGNFQDDINIFIDKTGKPRLIEAPSNELKLIQSKIKDYLHKCEYPEYVFSGVKNKTYISNANRHKYCKYMFKADISAFFPNISRNSVYNFFLNDLNTSPDVAKILTDLCTVNIKQACEKDAGVGEFVKQKKIRQMNHLCTGSPASQLLSYLANRKMFDELKIIADKNNLVFTVYVDDVFFSSQQPISKYIQNQIIATITKYGYNISRSKVKYYKAKNYKKITGVIITPDNMLNVPNKLKRKVVDNFSDGKYKVSHQSMQGLVYAARKIEQGIFQNIYQYVTKE